MALEFIFSLDDEDHAVSISRRRPGLVVSVDGQDFAVTESGVVGDDCMLLSVDGQDYEVWRAWDGGQMHVRIGGRSFVLDHADAITAAQHDAGAGDVVHADMPGVVVTISAAAGDTVSAGATMLVIESMKMQINVVAPRDGTIEAVHVGSEESFDKGAPLITFKSDEP